MAATAPVEILKLPVVAFAETVTDAGAVNAVAALLVSFTTDPPVGAAFDTVTVHVAAPFDVRAFGVHCSADTSTGVCRETVVDVEDPFSDAPRVAV